MDQSLLTFFNQYGLPGVVIMGLAYAYVRQEKQFLEREKLWKGVIDEQDKKLDSYVSTSLDIIKDDIKVKVELQGELANIKKQLDQLLLKGG